MTLKPPIPIPIILLVVIALVAHVGLMWSPYGAVLRGVGGNARAVERAGWSLLKAKVTMYSLAGICGVLAGLALLGLSGAADARIGERYTLLSIAAVILGGGEFVGGRVSPIGAVVGATTIWLAANSLLSALQAPARVADRRHRRDPHRGAGPALAGRAGGEGRMNGATAMVRRDPGQALDLGLRRGRRCLAGDGRVHQRAGRLRPGHGSLHLRQLLHAWWPSARCSSSRWGRATSTCPSRPPWSCPAPSPSRPWMATRRMIPIGLALAIVVGLAVGVFNFSLIRLLSIPPIIATLSSQFIILSVADRLEPRTAHQAARDPG